MRFQNPSKALKQKRTAQLSGRLSSLTQDYASFFAGVASARRRGRRQKPGQTVSMLSDLQLLRRTQLALFIGPDIALEDGAVSVCESGAVETEAPASVSLCLLDSTEAQA